MKKNGDKWGAKKPGVSVGLYELDGLFNLMNSMESSPF
jgi:hypothetical protein